MAKAPGIAHIFTGLSSREYVFALPTIGGPHVKLSGSWNGNATVENSTISWGGSNPSIEVPGPGTVSFLQILVEKSSSSLPIANINHTNVSVNTGDTIVYTSIEIEFETPDI